MAGASLLNIRVPDWIVGICSLVLTVFVGPTRITKIIFLSVLEWISRTSLRAILHESPMNDLPKLLLRLISEMGRVYTGFVEPFEPLLHTRLWVPSVYGLEYSFHVLLGIRRVQSPV
jgi:hypothetical protein